MTNTRNAIKSLREDLATGYWDDQSWSDLRTLLDVIERARQSEERTHKILTGNKPSRTDSSQTWRILSGEEA